MQGDFRGDKCQGTFRDHEGKPTRLKMSGDPKRPSRKTSVDKDVRKPKEAGRPTRLKGVRESIETMRGDQRGERCQGT